MTRTEAAALRVGDALVLYTHESNSPAPGESVIVRLADLTEAQLHVGLARVGTTGGDWYCGLCNLRRPTPTELLELRWL